MKIVQLVPITERVPPTKYGGTELVVSNITEELVRRGHEVYLLASGDSETKATLVPILPKSFRELYPRENYDPKDLKEIELYWKWRGMVDATVKIQEIKPDFVHNHMSWRGTLFSPLYNAPMITTMHGPVNVYQEKETFKDYPQGNFVSISDNQRKANPDLNWVKTVYNGIDTSKFEMGEGKGGYFVFLGRINPEKGIEEICQMIKKTNHKLKIAAKIDFTDSEFYETKIKPLIDGEQIEYIGEVDHSGKNAILKDATALLSWLNWEEPFGLVVPEANVCGTPVLVNGRGAMRELIQDGKNGYIVESMDDMQAKLDEVGKLDRAACRQHVEEHFSVTKMVDDYEALYQEILSKQK